MEHLAGRAILENNLSEKFSDFKGVRQDDTVSTVLCYITLDHILKKLTTRGTVTSKMTEINAKANDVVVTAQIKEMEEVLQAVNEKAIK